LEEKLVRDYTGFSFIEIYEMDLLEYYSFLHDAVIFRYNQTEEGQKYLEKCWILQQTAPDRKKLRQKFGRREGV
jgi:hypothetical protein